MICGNCGADIPEDAIFCGNCGARATIIATMEPNLQIKSVEKSYKKRKKTKSVLVGIIAVLLILVLLVLAYYSFFRKTTINLTEYVEIQFNGYDTFGQASYYFDYDSFEEDYGDKLKFTSKGKKESELFSIRDLATPVEAFELAEPYTVCIEPCQNLSNGETVRISITVDEVAEEAFNAKFVVEEKEEKVDGLEEVEFFDPFESVSVSFSGISPYGQAKCEVLAPYDFTFVARLDKDKLLANGDIVTVSVSTNDLTFTSDGRPAELSVDESFLRACGKIPSQTQKEYVVEGLPEKLTSVNQISNEFMTSLIDNGKEGLREVIYAPSATISDITYVGNCFLPGDDENFLFLMYRVKAIIEIPEQNYYGEVIFYDSIYAKDIIMESDDTFTVKSGFYYNQGDMFEVETTAIDRMKNNITYVFYGYDTIEALVNALKGEWNDYSYASLEINVEE